MALTRNTTSIAKQTSGNSATFVTGDVTDPNKVLKWDSKGNAISSGFEMTNDAFGGILPSSPSKIPTQESINSLINTKLGGADGAALNLIKINPVDNPASGVGGLSISLKVDGEQVITYTPPDALTADEIDITGFDSGEFVSIDSDGKLITSKMKKSLTIDSSSTDDTLPTSKAAFDYGQNITANRLLGVDDTITHGDFLSYNSATGGFEANSASISNHRLFSATHTDVASNVTPSYGDSMYYDGTEWTVGNFGNWGADMEYRGITSQNGATFSDLDYSGMNSDVRNMFNANGLRDAFSRPTASTAPAEGSNLSGNLSGLKLSSISNDYSTGNFNQIFDDREYKISGKVQFPINGFNGAGLVNSKIRGLYIRSQIFMHASDNFREAEMFVTYPDGSKQPLLRTDKQSYNEEGNVSTNIEEIVFVPVNEGQTQIEIEFNIDKVKAEGFAFEIIGALCTRRIELSPEVDHIQIVGSQELVDATDTSLDGYVDVNSVSLDSGAAGERADIWSSQTPTTAPSNNWSDVLPITIPDNVSKTVIKSKSAWVHTENKSEEHSTTEIIIDWNEQTIKGTFFSDDEDSQSGYLYSDNLTGLKEFEIEDSGNHRPIIRIEIDGRDIIKLPMPQHRNAAGGNQPYRNFALSYNIENYKTVAPTTKKLGTGFTTVGTTGTAEFDGYLLVTGLFDVGSNIDGFKVTIGTEVFLNDNYGYAGMVGRETMTLPIAAGESWSVAVGDDASVPANISFDVRFKAKSTEISDSNSFNLVDSGATGTFEITTPNTAYEELDLSPIVGTNKTLVVMEVLGGSGSPTSNLYFKTNGSSVLAYTAGSATGNGSAAVVISKEGGGGTVTVMTDVNGKVAYMGEYTGTVYYKVQGYQGVVSAPNGAIAYTGGESTTLPNGLIMKTGFAAETTTNTDSSHALTITFETPFPNGIISIQATGVDNTTSTAPAAQSNVHIKPGYDVNGFRMYTNTSSNNVGNFWTVIGY
jgi:hypothetical protein